MIALLVQNQCPTDELIRTLRQEEVEFELYIWEHALRESPPPKTDKAALIMAPSSVIAIGERTQEARSLLGDKTHLLVSAPELRESERSDLLKCGADTIIMTHTNSPEDIAEQIIAE